MQNRKNIFQRVLLGPFFITLWLARLLYYVHIPLFFVNYSLRNLYYWISKKPFPEIEKAIFYADARNRYERFDDRFNVAFYRKANVFDVIHRPFEKPILDAEKKQVLIGNSTNQFKDGDDIETIKRRAVAKHVLSLPFLGVLLVCFHLLCLPYYVGRLCWALPYYGFMVVSHFCLRKIHESWIWFIGFLGKQFSALMDVQSKQEE